MAIIDTIRGTQAPDVQRRIAAAAVLLFIKTSFIIPIQKLHSIEFLFHPGCAAAARPAFRIFPLRCNVRSFVYGVQQFCPLDQ